MEKKQKTSQLGDGSKPTMTLIIIHYHDFIMTGGNIPNIKRH